MIVGILAIVPLVAFGGSAAKVSAPDNPSQVDGASPE